MLDKEKGIDAVTVVIPDHMHTHAALAAMQLGKHVYVEKPLTRTPWEARLLTDAAAKYKVATQMGNQGYSHDATRVAAEIIWSGEIGDVTEVHSFRGRASWPQGMPTLPAPEKVPDTLDWDLWLGGARVAAVHVGRRGLSQGIHREQYGFYLPFNWRGFYDFGTSLIGDWGIHMLGPANWRCSSAARPASSALKLGEGKSPYTFPQRRRRRSSGSSPRARTCRRSPSTGPTPATLYTPPGMTAETRRAIPGTGPTIDNGRGGRGGGRGRGRGGPGGGAAAAGGGGGAAGAGGRRRRTRRPWRRWTAAGQRLQHRLRRDRRASSAPADAAKASACCRDRGGRNTSCRRRC